MSDAADRVARAIALDLFVDGVVMRDMRIVPRLDEALADRIADRLRPLLEACERTCRHALQDEGRFVQSLTTDIERMRVAYESLTSQEPTDGE
jgi:hypothetical protein